MKKYIFPVFSSIYILGIVLHSLLSSYEIAYDYYKIPKTNAVMKIIQTIFQIELVSIFTHFTGAGTGYGYFAPNVKSNGLIITESCGEKIIPHFKSFETKIRFHSLSSAIVENVLNDRNSTLKSQKNAKLEKGYYDLAFKNIALNLINKNGCQMDSVSISYNIIIIPTLEEKRLRNEHVISLLKYKELTFSINNKTYAE